MFFINKLLKKLKKPLEKFRSVRIFDQQIPFLKQNSSWFRKLYYTPSIQRLNIELDIIEAWFDLRRELLKQNNLRFNEETFKEFIPFLIHSAFTEQEWENEILIEANPDYCQFSEFNFNQKVDFLLKHKTHPNTLAIFVSNYSKEIDENTNDFGQAHVNTLLWMQNVAYFSDDWASMYAIITDGLNYQMYFFTENKDPVSTVMLRLFQKETANQITKLREIQGMIRYPLIRFENEILYDKFLNYSDDLSNEKK